MKSLALFFLLFNAEERHKPLLVVITSDTGFCEQ